MVIILIFLIIIILFIILFLKNKQCNDLLLKCFKRGNVITFGAKGKGKDLLHQKLINLRAKKNKKKGLKYTYFSNIDYGHNYQHITIKEISVEPNTFSHLIEDKISIIKKNVLMEGKDIFISDMGIYLPSHMDTLLTKLYPSFPIAYALSRHLWANNIHGNSQALNRIWLKIREQADSYFRCKLTIKFFGIIFTSWIYYEEYESANQKLLPFDYAMLNGHNTALLNQFNATNGLIKKGWSINFKKNIHYDTRIFHKKIFGIVFEEKK